MERFGGVLAIFVAAVPMVITGSAHARVKDAGLIVHPASASQVITVEVKELRAGRHGKDQEFVVAQAIGFPTETCDAVTTFDVVKPYEERQTWSNVRQRIDIVVKGVSYPAKFRDVGVYPLGLNLACVDFESPVDRAAVQISILPLEHDAQDVSALSYDDGEIAKSNPGTPFLNARGEISSVFISSPNGPVEFASAAELRQFLKIAQTVSAWPVVRHRPANSSV